MGTNSKIKKALAGKMEMDTTAKIKNMLPAAKTVLESLVRNKKAKKELFKIADRKAKSLDLKIESEIKTFWKKHCSRKTDELTIVLKCHLFIESCLDDLISLALPNPKSILEKSSFFQKIILFEALNFSTDKSLVKKLAAINKIRNGYIHNLDRSFTKKELVWLKRNLDVKTKKLSFKDILANLHYLIGYFHAERTITKTFPFITNLKRNDTLIEKDIYASFFWLALVEIGLDFHKVLAGLKK